MLLGELRRRGIGRVCIGGVDCGYDAPQCIALNVLLGRVGLCRGVARGKLIVDYGDVKVLRTSRIGEPCEVSLGRHCSDPVDISLSVPSPIFVIELSLWDVHTDSEKNELVEQVITSLSVIRRFLWDGNLVLSNPSPEFKERLGRMAKGMRHAVRTTDYPPLIKGRTVMLDPEGDCRLSDKGVVENDVFILGGIVDKEVKRRGMTRRLYEELGLDQHGIPRCRIELRGSRVGVPDRINKLIEAVILARFVSNLDDAILMCQSKRDRINRLVREIQRSSLRVNNTHVITRELLERINWLGASGGEVEEALRRAHALVIPGENI